MHFDLLEHHTAIGFKNPEPDFEEKKFRDLLKWGIIDRIKGIRPQHPDHYSFPLVYQKNDFKHAHEMPIALTWIGHSSYLITLNGINILTDPIWSDRCSPLQVFGPKRYAVPGIPFEDLPPIDVVLISHNHFDHLDRDTIRRLGNKPRYFIPLNLKPFFDQLGITNISEHDWWEGDSFKNLQITSTPAQHFSGRGLRDRNKSLWCGWIVSISSFKLYFAGDSGYFSGFREIGNRFGPIDIALIPIGAYLPRWFMKPVHLSPAEAVQAYLDVKAEIFIATHWGTFDLADEALDDPPVKLREEIIRKKLNPDLFWIFRHGESRTPTMEVFDLSHNQRVVLNAIK